MSALLDVRHLSTVFHTRAGDVTAARDLSYRLEAGKSLAIVGESGSGKTVNALSVMGLLPSNGEIVSGQILFNGEDLTRASTKRRQRIRGRDIAMIFQDPMTSMNPVLTVGAQLLETLVWHQGKSRQDATAQVIETLDIVGIPDAARRLADYPHQFSGGQRQRIMIAMAIVCRPSLLIADEPTTALDVTIQAQIVALIEELRERLGMAVIWITHDLGLIAGIVDDVAVMYAGSNVEYGPVRDVFGHPRHPYTQGLMASMPRFETPHRGRLESIDGAPPNLANLPAGCAFAPRCRHRVAKCQHDRPLLDDDASRNRVACWEAGSL